MDSNSPTPSNPVPTATWLTNMLLKTGDIKEGISVVTVKESDVGRMGKGNIVPYAIEYKSSKTIGDDKDESFNNLPKTMIVKFAVSGGKSDDNFDKGAPMNIDNNLFRFTTVAREAWVLQEMPKGTFSPPKIYHSIADVNEPEGMFILMEDLRCSTTRMDQFHGAQGGSNMDGDIAKPTMSSKEAWKVAFEEIAVTHATFWNLENLPNDAENRLKFGAWMKGDHRDEWETSLKACKIAWNKIDKSNMSERVKTFMTKCLENATFDRAVKHMNKNPKTLHHGDFHPKNLFWDDRQKQVIITDFSEVGIGNPICDLGLYILSDVGTDVRRGNEEEILKAYWNKLTSCGVDPDKYPFSKCWESYKKDGLDRFIWVFPILAYFNYNAQFFHDQIDGFLADHEVNVDDFVLVNGAEIVEETEKSVVGQKTFKIAR